MLRHIEDEELIKIAAWCVMDNHVHLLMKVDQEDLAIAMKRINIKFAMHYHKVHRTIGRVFQDRFKSEVIESGKIKSGIDRIYPIEQIVEADMNKVRELLQSAKDLDKNGYGLQANEVRGEIVRTSEKLNRVILKSQSCFTPQQVGQAQTYIAGIK